MTTAPTETETLNAALRSLELKRKEREALRMMLAGHLNDEIRERVGSDAATSINAILADRLSPQHYELLMQKYERASRRLIAERAAKSKDWWPDYRALTGEIERLKKILRDKCIRDPMTMQPSPFATPKRAA